MPNEKQKLNPSWHTVLEDGFLGFDQYRHVIPDCQHFGGLPTVADWEGIAARYYSLHQTPKADQIQFVPQGFDVSYEKMLVQHQCVYMRYPNWHDFFNNLTWLVWPKSKWTMVKKQADTEPAKNRNSQQSFLAQLDECGVLIVLSSMHLQQAISDHDWQTVFTHTRAQHHHLETVILGHGLLEKGLAPYIGMTGKALLVMVKPQYFRLPRFVRYRFLDEVLSAGLASSRCPTQAKQLQPFPLLGMPGWFENNQSKQFISNTQYFRPKRSVPAGSAVLNHFVNKNLWGQWKWLAPND